MSCWPRARRFPGDLDLELAVRDLDRLREEREAPDLLALGAETGLDGVGNVHAEEEPLARVPSLVAARLAVGDAEVVERQLLDLVGRQRRCCRRGGGSGRQSRPSR